MPNPAGDIICFFEMFFMCKKVYPLRDNNGRNVYIKTAHILRISFMINRLVI